MRPSLVAFGIGSFLLGLGHGLNSIWRLYEDIMVFVEKSRPLLVILGPTGTGKTSLAIQLAQILKTEIISADSRQVYRGLDIGTAKPTLAERASIPHHLLDRVDLTETYTVNQFQQDASPIIARLRAAGKIPILVGGTGFYIQAVTAGLALPPVPPDPALRTSPRSTPELHQQLQQLNPVRAAALHPQDRVRVLRALEIHQALGTIPKLQGVAPPYPVLTLGLDYLDRSIYTVRLQQRTEAMVAQGWLDELQQLQQRYGADHPLLDTLGYAQMGRYLRGEGSITQAIAETVLKTRQYAKRQRTWFRRDRTIHWFDPSTPALSLQVLAILRQELGQEAIPEQFTHGG